MYKPLGKDLLIELLNIEQKGFVEFDRDGKERKKLSYAIVLKKGESCRDVYKNGDKIVFISGQEYDLGNGTAFLHDDDVRGIEVEE